VIAYSKNVYHSPIGLIGLFPILKGLAMVLTTISKMKVGDWVKGILRSFISGGAGAIGSGISANIVDPDHFQVGNGQFHKLAALMGLTFLIGGVISLAAYLKQHPIPDDE
jgi:hypothetical protein